MSTLNAEEKPTILVVDDTPDNLTLVSNNTREFARVPGLKLEDWLAQ